VRLSEYVLASGLVVLSMRGTYHILTRRWRRTKGQVIRLGASILTITSCLTAVVAPWVLADALTCRYSNELRGVPRRGMFVGKVLDVRVFWATPWTAKALFVEEHAYHTHDGRFRRYKTGTFYWFRRCPGGPWIYTGQWDCVWSQMGSANGATYPLF